MKLRNILSAACIAAGALVSTPASAVFVSSYSAASGNLLTDFSSTGLAAFNLDLAQAYPPTTVNFQIEAGDLGGPLAFNAVIANLFDQGIEHFLLTLDHATFADIGSVETAFGALPSAYGSGALAGIDFAPAETFGFNIGDPFLAGGRDWMIDIAGLAVGDTFSLRLEVPEPGSLSLAIAALAAAGWVRRRRNPR